jgi:hypothetical protein
MSTGSPGGSGGPGIGGGSPGNGGDGSPDGDGGPGAGIPPLGANACRWIWYQGKWYNYENNCDGLCACHPPSTDGVEDHQVQDTTCLDGVKPSLAVYQP